MTLQSGPHNALFTLANLSANKLNRQICPTKIFVGRQYKNKADTNNNIEKAAAVNADLLAYMSADRIVDRDDLFTSVNSA